MVTTTFTPQMDLNPTAQLEFGFPKGSNKIYVTDRETGKIIAEAQETDTTDTYIVSVKCTHPNTSFYWALNHVTMPWPNDNKLPRYMGAAIMKHIHEMTHNGDTNG